MNTEQTHHSDRFQLGRKANPQSIRCVAVNFNKFLEQVKALLTGNGSSPAKRGPRPAKAAALAFGSNGSTAPKKRRTISAAGRERIAAAQKARWPS
jgi:hypothetical protein